MTRIIIITLNIILLILNVQTIHAFCVKVSKANIRKGPGTEYKKAWTIYRYMPLLKVGVSADGTWYAVKDVDGDVGWIHKKLVTAQYRCAIVKSETVNVRIGPGTSYQKSAMSPAFLYYAFKLIKRQSSWVKIKDEIGNIGWIHKNYLWIQ
jgi:SH3-like domain-containing protein